MRTNIHFSIFSVLCRIGHSPEKEPPSGATASHHGILGIVLLEKKHTFVHNPKDTSGTCGVVVWLQIRRSLHLKFFPSLRDAHLNAKYTTVSYPHKQAVGKEESWKIFQEIMFSFFNSYLLEGIDVMRVVGISSFIRLSCEALMNGCKTRETINLLSAFHTPEIPISILSVDESPFTV